MKIVTKNCSLTKGERGYLIYLTDDNGNSLECHDVTGEEEREEKENLIFGQVIEVAIQQSIRQER